MSGYYRMIEHPDESDVNPDNILAAHRQRTLQRMQGQDVALCVGSDLNFATRPGCKSLGIKNRNSSGTLGLHMHTTLVATVCRSASSASSTRTGRDIREEQTAGGSKNAAHGGCGTAPNLPPRSTARG